MPTNWVWCLHLRLLLICGLRVRHPGKDPSHRCLLRMLVDLLAVLWSRYQTTMELVTKIFQVLDKIRVTISPILPEWCAGVVACAQLEATQRSTRGRGNFLSLPH